MVLAAIQKVLSRWLLAAGNSKGAIPYGDIVNLVFVGATPCGRPLTMIWDN